MADTSSWPLPEDIIVPISASPLFAGQPLLISPELLLQEGLLAESDLSNVPAFPEEEVDFYG